MKILALEPYYGGSHQAFLDGWAAHSRHEWTVLGLPAYKWKWRMRHGAITMAERVGESVDAGSTWDVLFCSAMLNLAEFLGLAPGPLRNIPSVAYFHENQLTYPVRQESERDWHFAFTNLTTALAARQVWFNSVFHRDAFLEAGTAFLKRMPDFQPLGAIEHIRRRALVHPPGIPEFPPRGQRRAGPMRILWAARWEHDKNPEALFEALSILETRGVEFRLSVVGEQFAETPAVFEDARRKFAGKIDRWGHQDSRAAYQAALLEADVVVSTANHEFFGISVVEAIAAGAYPLLPNRLAYPEILGLEDSEPAADFLYEGGAGELAGRLGRLADRIEGGGLWEGDPGRCIRIASRFSWGQRAPELDEAIEKVRGPD